MNFWLIVGKALVIFAYISIYFVTRSAASYVYVESLRNKRAGDRKNNQIKDLVVMGSFFSAMVAVAYAYGFHSTTPTEDFPDTPYNDFTFQQFLSYFLVTSSIMISRLKHLLKSSPVTTSEKK